MTRLAVATLRRLALLGVAVLALGAPPAAADASTPPGGLAVMLPFFLSAGESYTLTVIVTPGTNPASTGLAVTCDLSPIGGSAAQQLAAGGVDQFVFEGTVPVTTPPSVKRGDCTVTDEQLRSGTVPWTIFVEPPKDAPPAIASTFPAGGAGDVARDANVEVTFTEPVDLAAGWFSISCSGSGDHAATVSGGPTAFTLDPTADFAPNETCSVTVYSADVFDRDSTPPDHMAADSTWSFTTAAPPANQPPTVDAGGPYVVAEGGTVTLSATGADPDGDTLSYAWDLNGDGTFETPGQSVTFSAAALDGPSAQTVQVQVTDAGGLTAVGTAQVTIENVPPTATFGVPASAFAGFDFTLSLSNPQDPSVADTAAGFTYAFDCGGGYGAFGTSSTASCPTADVGTLSVGGKIRDKDGGVTEYRATVQVTVTFDSLCALTRRYAGTANVDSLCRKLAHAAAAASARVRDNVLNAYRNEVDARTGSQPGKVFTPEQRAILNQLSMRLQA